MTTGETTNAAESEADKRLPYWADGPCPAWCDRDHPAWHKHMSTGWMCFVVLSTEDPVTVDLGRNGGKNYVPVPKELELYLEQHFREIGPRVVISQRPTGRPAMKLLPEEALHLGEGLIRLATMATDGTTLVKCEPCEDHSL
jgi:hypothetical protein